MVRRFYIIYGYILCKCEVTILCWESHSYIVGGLGTRRIPGDRYQDRCSHVHTDIVISNYNVPKREPLGLKSLCKSNNMLIR